MSDKPNIVGPEYLADLLHVPRELHGAQHDRDMADDKYHAKPPSLPNQT